MTGIALSLPDNDTMQDAPETAPPRTSTDCDEDFQWSNYLNDLSDVPAETSRDSSRDSSSGTILDDVASSSANVIQDQVPTSLRSSNQPTLSLSVASLPQKRQRVSDHGHPHLHEDAQNESHSMNQWPFSNLTRTVHLPDEIGRFNALGEQFGGTNNYLHVFPTCLKKLHELASKDVKAESPTEVRLRKGGGPAWRIRLGLLDLKGPTLKALQDRPHYMCAYIWRTPTFPANQHRTAESVFFGSNDYMSKTKLCFTLDVSGRRQDSDGSNFLEIQKHPKVAARPLTLYVHNHSEKRREEAFWHSASFQIQFCFFNKKPMLEWLQAHKDGDMNVVSNPFTFQLTSETASGRSRMSNLVNPAAQIDGSGAVPSNLNDEIASDDSVEANLIAYISKLSLNLKRKVFLLSSDEEREFMRNANQFDQVSIQVSQADVQPRRDEGRMLHITLGALWRTPNWTAAVKTTAHFIGTRHAVANIQTTMEHPPLSKRICDDVQVRWNELCRKDFGKVQAWLNVELAHLSASLDLRDLHTYWQGVEREARSNRTPRAPRIHAVREIDPNFVQLCQSSDQHGAAADSLPCYSVLCLTSPEKLRDNITVVHEDDMYILARFALLTKTEASTLQESIFRPYEQGRAEGSSAAGRPTLTPDELRRFWISRHALHILYVFYHCIFSDADEARWTYKQLLHDRRVLSTQLNWQVPRSPCFPDV